MSPPDYNDGDCWYACPPLDGGSSAASTYHVRGAPGAVTSAQAVADCFYIHPTTALQGLGNAEWSDDGSIPGWLASDIVRRQASCFNSCARIFAPRYRQARVSNYHCFEGEVDPHSGSKLPVYHQQPVGSAAFDMAYSDVRAAFLHFIEHFNSGRPFIVAGHSQGSQLLVRLLRELEGGSHRDCLSRLVIAYLPGCQCGADSLHELPMGTNAEQVGCWVSWATVGHGTTTTIATGRRRHGYVDASVVTEGPPLSVNPITWMASEALAAAGEQWSAPEVHRGALVDGVLHPHTLSTMCTPEGLVAAQVASASPAHAGGPPRAAVGSLVLAGDLHVHDYSLFWLDVRENAQLRVRQWEAARAKVR